MFLYHASRTTNVPMGDALHRRQEKPWRHEYLQHPDASVPIEICYLTWSVADAIGWGACLRIKSPVVYRVFIPDDSLVMVHTRAKWTADGPQGPILDWTKGYDPISNWGWMHAKDVHFVPASVRRGCRGEILHYGVAQVCGIVSSS